MENEYVPTGLLEQAARRFELQTHTRKAARHLPQDGRVITIARLFGAGAEEIVHVVGKELDWMIWDDQIVDLMASETHKSYQMRMFRALDEKAQGRIEEMLSVFCDGDPAEAYLRLLPSTLHTIAAHDAIIIGRAAHLFLPDSLRVLIKAPLEKRIAYVMQHHTMTENEAEKEVKQEDSNRRRFLKEMARQYEAIEYNNRKQMAYDIELNTGKLSAEDAADIIIHAARRKFGA